MTERESWFGGIALAALLLFPLGDGGMSESSRKFYTTLRRDYPVAIMPPGWLFGPVWFMLYLLMAVAIVLWTAEADQNSWLWLGVWITAIVNFFFNKIWSLLFFSYRLVRLAAADAVLIFLTAATVLVFLCFKNTSIDADVDSMTNLTANVSSDLSHPDDDLSTRQIVALVLWAIYTTWTLFAMILSIWIAARVPAEALKRSHGALITPQTYAAQ
jgi:tryptophan-rich sensory protein